MNVVKNACLLGMAVALSGCFTKPANVYSSATELAGSNNRGLIIVEADGSEDLESDSISFKGIQLRFLYLEDGVLGLKHMREAEQFWYWGSGVKLSEMPSGIYVLDYIWPQPSPRSLEFKAEDRLKMIHQQILNGKELDLSRYPGVFRLKAGEAINLGSISVKWSDRRVSGDGTGRNPWAFIVRNNQAQALAVMQEAYGDNWSEENLPVLYSPLEMPQEIIWRAPRLLETTEQNDVKD